MRITNLIPIIRVKYIKINIYEWNERWIKIYELYGELPITGRYLNGYIGDWDWIESDIAFLSE
jgi:hypothetical protein